MPRYYRDQQAWKDLQMFLPERLRLDESTAPQEEFWDWHGNQVHLDRYSNPAAPVKVVLLHGVGTNGRQMSLILGAPLARRGFETIAIDNLGYGLTDVAPGTVPGYGDWVDLVVDYLEYERRRDVRPIVLYGLSAGGMLAYHVAAKAPRDTVRGIIGMTFLDQRVREVADGTAHDLLTARVGVPFLRLAAKTPARRVRYPMWLAAKMSTLANSRAAMKVFMKDRTSAANWVSVKFLAEYMSYAPAVEPADFDVCPIILTQPDEDQWTPYEFSKPVLDPISKVPVTVVPLERAGHYPLEDPGLQQLEDAAVGFIRAVAG
ncbi:alpha/beta fold hydrolase [Mycobacteroides franklinii]|uniref:alpha/beta fold hydrolase n=1 Tax=Mycobacteroides franklinii TaxID=948102 RepID=UPI0013E8D188|nr:lysophospholipase [Mycobacteroides franklinii]